MKKRAFCLLLAAVLLFCLSAQASGAGFFRHLQYGDLAPYENMVFGYSLSVYERFEMLSDELLDQYWQHIEEEADPDADEIYDFRIWFSQDGRYEFQVQVKEPTYDSFATEIEKAPDYLELVRDQYPEDSHVRMLHEGKLRDTSAGQMLETALAYDQTDESGHGYTTVFVYYDFYAEDTEYCFTLYAYDGDYTAAQGMLDEICQTIEFAQSVGGYIA